MTISDNIPSVPGDHVGISEHFWQRGTSSAYKEGRCLSRTLVTIGLCQVSSTVSVHQTKSEVNEAIAQKEDTCTLTQGISGVHHEQIVENEHIRQNAAQVHSMICEDYRKVKRRFVSTSEP